MKRIKIISAFLTIFLAISLSCSEEWLKPEPLSFYAPENVFVDQAGFEAGLQVCKKDIVNENHGQRHPICTEHAYSDLACALFQCDFRKNTPSSSAYFPILNYFLNVYGYIKNTNTIISRIDGITWTDENDKKLILSEALWFRAYWYYRLVHTYGDIPWVGEELKGARLDYYSTTRWAILDQLQKDLEYAVENLPVTPKRAGDVSKGAANHLLAKVYLAKCDFDKAIAALTEVIDGPYALMKQRFGIDAGKKWHDMMWDLHRCENKNVAANTETIYANVDRPDAPKETWSAGTYSMRLYQPSYWKVLDATGSPASYHLNVPGGGGDSLGNGNNDVRTNDFFHYRLWEDETYTWETTPDMRRSDGNWIEMGDSIAEILTWRPGSPNFGQPLTRKYYKSLADTIDTWYSFPYYKTYNPTPTSTNPSGGQGDWYIFRLAETYLLRAEAYYWKGQNDLAADDINKVRERAKAPLITAADVTLDYIFDERARELYTEEPRHSEMVRVSFIQGKLNINGYNLSNLHQKNWYHDRVMRVNYYYTSPRFIFYGNTSNLDPHNYLWPVPQSVITANTKGRINQNLGYDGADLNVAPLETIP